MTDDWVGNAHERRKEKMMGDFNRTANQEAVPWRAVSYVRLSKEDQVGGESDSIVGQKLLIEDWVK